MDPTLKQLKEFVDHTKKITEATEAMATELKKLYLEIDCRIEHGADSSGHLEYVRYELERINEVVEVILNNNPKD
jgi:hypothetical protein